MNTQLLLLALAAGFFAGMLFGGLSMFVLLRMKPGNGGGTSFAWPVNWKPKLAGLIIGGEAVWPVIKGVYVNSGDTTAVAALSDKHFWLAASVAVAMFFLKQHNTTGGSVAATPEAVARVTAKV
jgi:hypothetical protein